RTLVYCFAATAAIALLTHVVAYGALISWISRMASIAVALARAMAVARLVKAPRRLVVPAKAPHAKAPPYRATPDDPTPTAVVEITPQVHVLARWASVAAWADFGVEVAVFAWAAFIDVVGYSIFRELRAIQQLIWLCSTLVEVAAICLLVVWM